MQAFPFSGPMPFSWFSLWLSGDKTEEPAFREEEDQEECADWVRGENDSSEERLEAQGVKLGDKLYVFGGFRAGLKVTPVMEIYHPATDTWTRGADMPIAVTHMAVSLVDGEIWSIAGFEGNNPGDAIVNVQIYNVEEDAWREGIPLPRKRASGAAVYLDGKVHYYGGLAEDRQSDRGNHYVLDLERPGLGWVEYAPLPFPRNHHSGVVIDGKIYAIGGQYGHGAQARDTKLLHVYNPATDTWKRLPDLPRTRSHFEPGTMVDEDGTIIIVGGRDKNFFFNNVTRYNPATGCWTELCPLPSDLLAPVAKVFDGELIVTNGGRNGIGKPQAAVWRMPLQRVDPNEASCFPPEPPGPADNLVVAKPGRNYDDIRRFVRLMEYPNPATRRVVFYFQLPEEAEVELRLADLQGRTLQITPARQLSRGPQMMELDLSGIPPGTLVYQLRIDDEVIPGRVIKAE